MPIELIVCRDRFSLHAVQCSAGHGSVRERAVERFFIDDAASRVVDDVDALLHPLECILVKDILSLQRWAVDRDDVGLFDELVQRDAGYIAAGCNLTRLQVMVTGDDVAAQSVNALGKCASDPPEAEDAHGQGGKPLDGEGHGAVPGVFLRTAVHVNNLPDQCHHQCQRLIGHFVGSVIRDVADDNPALDRFCDFDVVDTDTVANHHLEVRQIVHHSGGNGSVLVDEDIRILAIGDHIVFGPALMHREAQSCAFDYPALNVQTRMVDIRIHDGHV